MGFRDVIDEFEDDDGLADASTTKGSGFATLDEGANEIDDLNAGLEDFGLGILLGERGRRTVNWVALFEFDRAFAVDRVAGDVEDAAEHAVAHGHGDGRAGIDDGHTADETFG